MPMSLSLSAYVGKRRREHLDVGLDLIGDLVGELLERRRGSRPVRRTRERLRDRRAHAGERQGSPRRRGRPPDRPCRSSPPTSVVSSDVVSVVVVSSTVVSSVVAADSLSLPPQPAATSASAITRSASHRIGRDPNSDLRQMLREEPDDRVVTANAVSELQHVVALVLEDEVVDVPSEPAQLLDDVARLALDHPRVVLALDDEQRARDVGDVRLR